MNIAITGHTKGIGLACSNLLVGSTGYSRSNGWNIAHTEGYIKALENNLSFSELETLTDNDKYNEYILTGIRTKWGISLKEIDYKFGKEKTEYFLLQLKKYNKTDFIRIENGIVTLTRKGIFISDEIMTNLMYI